MAKTVANKDEGSSGRGGGRPPRGERQGKSERPAKAGKQPPPEPTASEKAQSGIDELRKYFKGVQAEMKRIAWPTREELRAYTMVVLFTLVVVTLYLFLCDLTFTHIFGWLIKLLH